MDKQLKDSSLEQAHLDFISTVSHELRTPLTSIRGFADTLITSFEKLSPEQRMKFLTIIKDQSNRLIDLVENLLMVSKMQSDKESFIYRSIDIDEVIDLSIQVIKAQYKSHKFIYKKSKNIPNVFVDIDKCQQILINILDNAAKYSDPESDIAISVKLSRDCTFVSVNIEDSGIGIPEEYLNKIFEKFSRIDSPLTRKIQGSGLGLYITKGLVEKMNGRIAVKSDDKGSCFSVEFPVTLIEDACRNRLKK